MTNPLPNAPTDNEPDKAEHAPEIDVDFDFRSDTPTGKDPDSHSPTLRRYHRMLWSKPLPNGHVFVLTTDTKGVYLHHDSELGRFFLSSDTVANSHRKRLHGYYTQLPDETNEEFHRLGYTIGGNMVFPGNRIERRFTINQHRGVSRLIEDRIDLTLECIRRYYAGEGSPLGETIARYSDFFELFVDFDGYVNFFLLQDLVNDRAEVDFFLPFDGFESSPLPKSLESYVDYRERVLDFVRARNRRIDSLHGGSRTPARPSV
ncbi:hypothetical protein [Cryobacterium sp. BB307]|uniref:DUF6994 family protein n=1 Tax=Cryobacterium sp. BB307 TaxID=2716317 RepID=UPI001B2FFC0F|nr:hypothetical protein [Cryobacterium sp. BB307]